MTDKIVVLTTCGSAAEAERLAGALIEARLAACVNVLGGVKSFYRWKGAMEASAEWLVVIKSSRALFEALKGVLVKLHSYELPEIVALPVVEGSEEYLAWLDRELSVL